MFDGGRLYGYLVHRVKENIISVNAHDPPHCSSSLSKFALHEAPVCPVMLLGDHSSGQLVLSATQSL